MDFMKNNLPYLNQERLNIIFDHVYVHWIWRCIHTISQNLQNIWLLLYLQKKGDFQKFRYCKRMQKSDRPDVSAIHMFSIGFKTWCISNKSLASAVFKNLWYIPSHNLNRGPGQKKFLIVSLLEEANSKRRSDIKKTFRFENAICGL